jgi:hypothetical protein
MLHKDNEKRYGGQNVTLLGSFRATTESPITLVSEVLVLLAIERNTRRG